MKTIAAGLLMYRTQDRMVEYFLVHPGGPFFRNKNIGSWTIPKGLPAAGEDLLETAQREFYEETGIHPKEPYLPLGSIKQKGGKVVHAWCFNGAWDPSSGIVCNSFTLEWPPRSGKQASFPEVDKAAWFSLEAAVDIIIPEQAPFLNRAAELISG